MAGVDNYDWNIPARSVTPANLVVNDEFGQPSIFEGDCLPEDAAEINRLVTSSGLNHGDVIRMGDYRDTHTYIVNREHDGTYNFVRNPDDSCSGYLTIPEVILKNVTDALKKYSAIIKGNSVSVNFHLSPQDRMIRDKLGENIPEDWQFDVCFNWGEREHFAIKCGHSDFTQFDLDKTSMADIQLFMEGAQLEQSTFIVKMNLKNEKYEEYKQKYGSQHDSLAWMLAVPEHPVTWRIEPGAMGMGSSYCRRDWICSGPKEQEQEVKDAIEEFLVGFEYRIVEHEGAE